MPNFAPILKAGARGVDALVDALRTFEAPAAEAVKPKITQGLLSYPRNSAMPDVPNFEQMQRLSRIENVPLENARSFQQARNWEMFGKNPRGDLIEGYGQHPVALRIENGEYVIYDGNHRTDLAIKAGKKDLPMHVIDVKAYDPAHAGRRPAPPSISDDELLRQLLGN